MMMLNLMPNLAYSACLTREFLDSDKALELEEKHFHKDLEQIIARHYPHDTGYKPLGFDQREEDEEDEEEDEEEEDDDEDEDDDEEEDIDMGGGAGAGNGGGNSVEGGRDEFDDYAEELEASDIEGGAGGHL